MQIFYGIMIVMFAIRLINSKEELVGSAEFIALAVSVGFFINTFGG